MHPGLKLLKPLIKIDFHGSSRTPAKPSTQSEQQKANAFP